MNRHETQESKRTPEPDNAEHSFNDVTEYNRTVLGMNPKRVDLSSMPKPIRWFGYFFYTAIVLGMLVFLYAAIFK